MISEPIGGAHRDPESIADDIKYSLIKNLRSFEKYSKEEIFDHRKAKFLQIGRNLGYRKSTYSNDMKLSFKESISDKIKLNIQKNKLIYLGAVLLLAIGIGYTIY